MATLGRWSVALATVLLLLGAPLPARAVEPGPKAEGRPIAPTTVTEAGGVRISSFDFGNLSIPGGFSVPLRGSLIVPAAAEPRSSPLVLISHLRMPGCGLEGTVYPCPAGQPEQRFDQGMVYLGEALAKQGYASLIPDLSPLFSPLSLVQPYPQTDAAVALYDALLERLPTASYGLDAAAVDTSRLAVFAHSRSGVMADALGRAWASGKHPVRTILAYGPGYGVERADGVWDPPHPDVPVLVVVGGADRDVKTFPNEFATHSLPSRRTAPEILVSLEGFGHSYINRTLSDASRDERTECDQGCPDAAAHEKLVIDAATEWFGATLRGGATTLPLRPLSPLPDRAFGYPARVLAVSNGSVLASVFSGTPTEQDAVAPASTAKHELCSMAEPMAPTEGQTYCNTETLGDFGIYAQPLRRVAFTASESVTYDLGAGATGVAGVTLHLGPGMDQPVGVPGTRLTVILRDAAGDSLPPITVDPASPALANRVPAGGGYGSYSIYTVRVPLVNVPDLEHRTWTSVSIGGAGQPGVIYLRGVELVGLPEASPEPGGGGGLGWLWAVAGLLVAAVIAGAVLRD